MQNNPSRMRLESQGQMTSCPWQIIKTKTAVDAMKKIIIRHGAISAGKTPEQTCETPKSKQSLKCPTKYRCYIITTKIKLKFYTTV